MLNINMVRVDERLIHGQIIIKWIQFKDANRILVVGNNVGKDPLMESVLRLSVPKNINLEIYNLEEGIKILSTNKADDNVIVLVEHLWVVKTMHQKGLNIKKVNIGRIPSGTGKKKIHPNIFLSEEDIGIINYFKKENIPVIIRIVPDSPSINVYDLI